MTKPAEVGGTGAAVDVGVGVAVGTGAVPGVWVGVAVATGVSVDVSVGVAVGTGAVPGVWVGVAVGTGVAVAVGTGAVPGVWVGVAAGAGVASVMVAGVRMGFGASAGVAVGALLGVAVGAFGGFVAKGERREKAVVAWVARRSDFPLELAARAPIECTPIDSTGTTRRAMKSPFAPVVAMGMPLTLPSQSSWTCVFAGKRAPVTVTAAPAGPESGEAASVGMAASAGSTKNKRADTMTAMIAAVTALG